MLGHHRTLLSRRRSTWPEGTSALPSTPPRSYRPPLDGGRSPTELRTHRSPTSSSPSTARRTPNEPSHRRSVATRTGVPLRLLRQSPTSDKDVAADYLAGVADPPCRPDRHRDHCRRPGEHRRHPRLARSGTLSRVHVVASAAAASPAVMGSVAEAVLRWLDRPALVVGPHVSDEAIFSGRAVACIDGSTESG